MCAVQAPFGLEQGTGSYKDHIHPSDQGRLQLFDLATTRRLIAGAIQFVGRIFIDGMINAQPLMQISYHLAQIVLKHPGDGSVHIEFTHRP